MLMLSVHRVPVCLYACQGSEAHHTRWRYTPTGTFYAHAQSLLMPALAALCKQVCASRTYRTYAQAAAAGAAAVSETQSLDVTSQLCIICIPLHPTALFTDEREQCTRIERLCFCQCFSL